MRVIILLTLLSTAHLSSATIDVQALSDTASNKLQTIVDHASNALQGLTDNIDPEKVKQLDFLNIIPRIQHRLNPQAGPSPLDKIKFYLDQAKGLTGSDLLLAFDAGVPWPAWRRMDEDF